MFSPLTTEPSSQTNDQPRGPGPTGLLIMSGMSYLGSQSIKGSLIGSHRLHQKPITKLIEAFRLGFTLRN